MKEEGIRERGFCYRVVSKDAEIIPAQNDLLEAREMRSPMSKALLHAHLSLSRVRSEVGRGTFYRKISKRVISHSERLFAYPFYAFLFFFFF